MVEPRRLDRLKQRARKLRTETYALYLATRDPRVPWYAKLLAAAVLGYALSPVDLIPDVMPVLGYLDDLLIVPAGIALALRMIPPGVMEECRLKARDAMASGTGRHWTAAAVIIGLWLLAVAVVAVVVVRTVWRPG